MRIFKIAAALLALQSGAALADPFSNAPGEGGAIPRGAFEAGYEADGKAFYSCIAPYQGGWHPGKIRPGFSGCNFGYGGRELTSSSYRVLTGSYNWIPMSRPGQLPRNAILLGSESNGDALYGCRAPYNGGWHPGKIRGGFGGCNIGYGGREITVQSYDVLVP